MKLVSVTLAGGNRESVIRGAIESVQDWVDEVVLIDTMDATAAIALVRSFCRVPVTVIPLSDRIRQNWICGEARNEALDAAATVGAHWAVNVDTDERIRLRGEKIRRLLEQTPDEVTHFLAWNDDHSYPKARAFRIPRVGGYQPHNVHEFYLPTDNRAVFPKLRFSEVEKTVEQQRAHNQAVFEGSLRQSEEEPTSPRWWFYAADSLVRIVKDRLSDAQPDADKYDIESERNNLEAARLNFEKSASFDSNPESKAWALTCAADCCGMLSDYDEGLLLCGQALAVFPGSPETACIAAQLAGDAERYQHGLLWCQLAISLGKYQGCGNGVPRIGFTDQTAYWETPYILMAQIMESQGKKREGDALRCTAEIAQSRRLEAQR